MGRQTLLHPPNPHCPSSSTGCPAELLLADHHDRQQTGSDDWGVVQSPWALAALQGEELQQGLLENSLES